MKRVKNSGIELAHHVRICGNTGLGVGLLSYYCSTAGFFLLVDVLAIASIFAGDLEAPSVFDDTAPHP